MAGSTTSDFNGDGKFDILAGGTTNTNGSVFPFFGDGTGNFTVQPRIETFQKPFSVQAGHFNTDGALDFMVQGIVGGSFAIMLGDGIGGFTGPNLVEAFNFNSLNPFGTGDLNGDGLDDIVTARFPDGSGIDQFLNVILWIPPDVVAFQSPPGDFSTLVRNADGTFTRRLKNGTEIDFDAAGFQTSVVDRNGNATSYGYDASGLLTTITDPAGLVTTLAYTGGLLTGVTGLAGRVTSFGHDGTGNLTAIADPDLSQRLFGYDARHRLTSQTSKRNFVTTYDYDSAGRVVRANRPDGSTTELAASETVGLVDPASGAGTEANPAPFVRPAAGAAGFTDGNGNATAFETDTFGATTRSVDALGRETLTTRDADAKATRIVAPSGRDDRFTYDERGNLTRRVEAFGDPLRRDTRFEYDGLFNQVTKVTDPANNVTTFAYDTNGNLTSITDAAVTQTVLAYADVNCPGSVTSVTRAVGLPEEATATMTYDPVTCNLTGTTDSLGNPTTFAYGPAGNMVSVTDALLRESRVVYDGLNRVTKSIDATDSDPAPACGVAGVTCFAFDAAGNLASLTDANGNVTDFAYDTRERVTDRTDPLLNAETFSYDGQGNLRFATDRKGQTTELQFDLVDRLVKKIMQPGQPEEEVRDIAYDLVDNLTSVVDPDSALAFTYDLLNRVGTASTAGSAFQPAVVLTATYDENDNRLTLDDPVGQSVFAYDALNRLTDLTTPSLPLQPVLYSYDALSRRTGVSLPNGVDTSLTFDTASRLTDISHVLGGATTVSSFAYGHNVVNQRTLMSFVKPWGRDSLSPLCGREFVGGWLVQGRGRDLETSVIKL